MAVKNVRHDKEIKLTVLQSPKYSIQGNKLDSFSMLVGIRIDVI